MMTDGHRTETHNVALARAQLDVTARHNAMCPPSIMHYVSGASSYDSVGLLPARPSVMLQLLERNFLPSVEPRMAGDKRACRAPSTDRPAAVGG